MLNLKVCYPEDGGLLTDKTRRNGILVEFIMAKRETWQHEKELYGIVIDERSGRFGLVQARFLTYVKE